MYDYLKPGGTFYFFEHVASKHNGARSTQGEAHHCLKRLQNELIPVVLVTDRLNPLWKFLFGGCNLNRATDKWILEGFEWAETKGKTATLYRHTLPEIRSADAHAVGRRDGY